MDEVRRISRLVRAVATPGREAERLAHGLTDRAKSLVRAGGGIEAATSGPIETPATPRPTWRACWAPTSRSSGRCGPTRR
jgi:hypothetical protein